MPRSTQLRLFRFLQPRTDPSKLRSAPEQRSRIGIQREIVTLALRDTLTRLRLPPDRVRADVTPIRSSTNAERAQVLLVLQEQMGDIAVSSVAHLQQVFLRRLRLLDKTSGSWLQEIVWKLSVPDTATSPRPEVGKPAPNLALSREALLEPQRDAYFERQTAPGFQSTQPMEYKDTD